MKSLVQLFFSISTMGKGPQDVPYSKPLFVILIIIIAVMDLFVLNALSREMATANAEEVDFSRHVLAYAFIMLVLIGSVALLVRLHGYANRILQTLTAMAGVEVIIKIVQIAILVITLAAGKLSIVSVIAYFLMVMTFGWILIANFHIFMHALSVSPLRAGAYSLAYFFLNVLLSSLY